MIMAIEYISILIPLLQRVQKFDLGVKVVAVCNSNATRKAVLPPCTMCHEIVLHVSFLRRT